MASYLVTGASRGIGFEFVRQLSADPTNIVIALVRDKEAAEKKIAAEIGASNITVVQADITDTDALKAAVETVSKATNGRLDYLIANAGRMPVQFGNDDVDDLASADPKQLEEEMMECYRHNVVGNTYLFHHFIPFLRNSDIKKVIALSTGLADKEITRELRLTLALPYAVSKAALNILITKFQAQYIEDGILFLSVCPGPVNTRPPPDLNEKQMKNMMSMFGSFQQYQPNFTAPAEPSEAVSNVLKVIYNARVEKDAGDSVSRNGNKQWL